MNAVKEFCVDYKGLMDANRDFSRKHWKGIIIVNVAALAVVVLAPVTIDAVDKLKNKIDAKRNSKFQDEEIEA